MTLKKLFKIKKKITNTSFIIFINGIKYALFDLKPIYKKAYKEGQKIIITKGEL